NPTYKLLWDGENLTGRCSSRQSSGHPCPSENYRLLTNLFGAKAQLRTKKPGFINKNRVPKINIPNS
ncbi:MAG: hypothetical protein AAFY21_15450, partial [Cyanobacteria bacterium J06641_2]